MNWLLLTLTLACAGVKVGDDPPQREEEHGDDHDKDHGHGHDKDHDDEHAGHDDEEKETHSEFVAHYRFDCADPEALTRVATGYFQAFPRGRELEVVVLSERGQASGELTPDATSFAF